MAKKKNSKREIMERLRKRAERVVTAAMYAVMGEQLKHMQAHAEMLQDCYKNENKE